MLGALTGTSGVKIEIRLTPYPQQLVVPMDHMPSWKLHKNPFWRVKHPIGSRSSSSSSSSAKNMATVTPVLTANGELEVHHSQIFAYEASQDVGGIVTITMPPGKKTDHLGIKIMFIGRIDMVRIHTYTTKRSTKLRLGDHHVLL